MSRGAGGDGLRLVGIGVAACAACCAVPIVGFLAAAGLFTLAGVAAFGAAGLLVLVPTALWWSHRRRVGARAVPDEPVPVEFGRRS